MIIRSLFPICFSLQCRKLVCGVFMSEGKQCPMSSQPVVSYYTYFNKTTVAEFDFQASPISEIVRSCNCCLRSSKMPTLEYNRTNSVVIHNAPILNIIQSSYNRRCHIIYNISLLQVNSFDLCSKTITTLYFKRDRTQRKRKKTTNKQSNAKKNKNK